VCMGGGLCFASKWSSVQMLYYKQFLDKCCGIQKDCWLVDNYILEEVWVMSGY